MTSRRPGSPASCPLPVRRAALAAGLLLAAASSQAQQDGGARALTVTPNASVTETLTDNVLLDDARKRSDSVTELTVGVRMASRGRVRGFLDYQLTGSVHARESRENNLSNSLRAGMNAILVDNFLFLDGSASISQQAVSAFGVQTANASFDNRNRTEVRSYTITPSMRGLIGGWARYDVRWSHTQQSSSNSDLGDSTDQALSVVLSSASASRVGWSLSAVQSRSDFDAGRATDTKHAKGTLSYRATPELGLSASAGREWSDLLGDTGGRQTWSAGLNWTPTERTRLNAQRERRFFGDTHAVSFEHRMKRSTWRFSSSEDISTSSPSVVSAGTIALYDLLFANFATQYPDPLTRGEKVLEFMQRQNLNPNQAVPIGFLQSAVSLTKRQEFGVAFSGLRTTVSLSASRSDSRRIDALATTRDDLSLAGRVKQSVVSATVGHRLNPTDSLNLLLLQQRTQGSTSDQQSDLKSISLNWSGQFGIRSSLSFGARHVEYDSLVTPYTENAIFATLGVRF